MFNFNWNLNIKFKSQFNSKYIFFALGKILNYLLYSKKYIISEKSGISYVL